MKKAIAVLLLLSAGIAALLIAARVGRSRFAQETHDAFTTLEGLLQRHEPRRYTPADLEGLPPPVRAYLQKAMPPSGPRILRLDLTQRGETKMAEDASWDAFTARQRITASPEQLVWAGEVDYLPLLPVTTLYTLQGPRARIDSYLLGLSRSFGNSGLEVRRYLMLRYLAEAVWHPDALLPSASLSWEPAEAATPNTQTARARLRLDDDEVSGLFIFSGPGSPPMLFLADAQASGQFAGQRWYCQYSDWRRQGQLQIPFELVQGVRQGIGDDRRLRLQVSAVDYLLAADQTDP